MPLSYFVHMAESICFGTSWSSPVFSEFTSDIAYPLLRKGKPNRILVYAGCFNPPHLGHLELLAHVFLRADRHTIAAMLIPVGGIQHKVLMKGEAFTLTKTQRSLLLRDSLLSRFSWICKHESRNVDHFQNTMIRLAKAERYTLSFTGVSGSDHYAIDKHISETGLDWGSGDLVTSDITRPSCLLADSGVQPIRLEGREHWRKILPVKSISRKGRTWCWPCWKFQAICPELAGKFLLYDEPPNLFGSIALQILRRCHEPDNGVIWMCHRKDEAGVVWFNPSGRRYPTDERRRAISSTMIQTALHATEKHKAFEGIKHMAMNPQQLLFFLNSKQGAMLHTNTKNCKSQTCIDIDTSSIDVELGEGTRLEPSFEGSAKAKTDEFIGMKTESALQAFRRRRNTT